MALNIPTTIDNITKDTKLAVMNFINVLKRIPLFLLFMVQYYGDITRSLVTQPLSNRQKKTENARMK